MQEPIIFDETVSYNLFRLTTIYRNAVERAMGAIGLHSGQAFILIELWRENGLRQVELARRLNVRAPTVTATIRSLVEINLVIQSGDPTDKRSVCVFLTEKGRKIRTEVERQWIDLEAECVGELNKTELLVLTDVLRKLRSVYTGQRIIEEE